MRETDLHEPVHSEEVLFPPLEELEVVEELLKISAALVTETV